VVSGDRGNVFLTNTATLQPAHLAVPEGWAVAGAAFSPDEAHLVVVIIQPEQKRLAFLLLETGLQQARSLPEGSQFLRWLSDDTILLKKAAGLARFEIASGTLLPVFEPPGWKVSTIIPGTAIQLLAGEDGRIAVRNGPIPVRQVLPGVKISQTFAVADDLSLFGALDPEKRLWIQHGLMAQPEVAAEQVKKALWGPISRRVLVEKTDGKFQVYDGRDGSWLALPPILAAQWSPNEERLLYVEAERQNSEVIPKHLSLLNGRNNSPICELTRIGDVASMALTTGDQSAFLLSGPPGALQVWMMALPRDN
jgi:hypothetical protein